MKGQKRRAIQENWRATPQADTHSALGAPGNSNQCFLPSGATFPLDTGHDMRLASMVLW